MSMWGTGTEDLVAPYHSYPYLMLCDGGQPYRHLVIVTMFTLTSGIFLDLQKGLEY